MNKFTFNKEEHYYELNGKRLYGVTTILQVLNKPALIPWAVGEAIKYIENNCSFSEADNAYLVSLASLSEAKSAHRKKKESAGEKGTDAHSQIENIIKDAIENQEGLLSDTLKVENQQVQHFINWAASNKVQFIASEKQLYSESMWVAGTTDMVFIKDGKKYVGDIKTSSAVYPEHFYQMAAYRMMLEEMGETDFEGSVVIRLGKDGKFNEDKDVKYRFDFETDRNAFLGALAIFKANETYASKTY